MADEQRRKRPKKKTSAFSIRIPDELKRKLEEIAEREVRSLSQQVEKFIIEGIERHERGGK